MIIKHNNRSSFDYQKLCVAAIWLTALYSSVIQFVIIQINYGMLIFGMAILISYILICIDKPYEPRKELSIEVIYMLFFMMYMLAFGLLFSVDRNAHLSQWITSLEYLFLLIVVSSIIQKTGTDTFCYLLLVEALILAIIFLKNPIDYRGRYSISLEVNPNGLGMSFAAGIWSALYIYQRKKMPLIIISAIIGLLSYCILFTGSRKSLLAMGLMIGLWLIMCFIPETKRQGGINGIVTFILMIVFACVLGYVFFSQYTDSMIADRMNDLTYEVSEGERSNMYRVGYEFLEKNPLFGLGFQGFQHEYGSYSHATLVEIPVSGGIIGTLLYFYVYYISIKRVLYIYRLTRRNQEYKYDHIRIKMIMVLWTVMLFYTTCIIHPYQFESYVFLGIIFGNTTYLYNKYDKGIKEEVKKIGSRYIKYE